MEENYVQILGSLWQDEYKEISLNFSIANGLDFGSIYCLYILYTIIVLIVYRFSYISHNHLFKFLDKNGEACDILFV